MLWKKRNEVIKMKKNKLSIVALIISLLPFITLLISLFTEEITGGLQMGFKYNFNIVWFWNFNFIDKKSKTSRYIFYYFFMYLRLFCFAHGRYSCLWFYLHFYVSCIYEEYIDCRRLNDLFEFTM